VVDIIHASTGEIIRELILNSAVDYQPRGVLQILRYHREFVESVHHLLQFLELLRPGCGLASHDQLGITR
jgi:hypothetical protein